MNSPSLCHFHGHRRPDAIMLLTLHCPSKKLTSTDLPLPNQSPPASNKSVLYYRSCLSDLHHICMYNLKFQSSYSTRCQSAQQTLKPFILYFNNFKTSLFKPGDNSTTKSYNICNKSLNSNLKIFYQNVRGLKTKLVNLRCPFPMFNFYDVIILTETWLTPDISDSELGFHGFQMFKLDRNSNNSSFLRGGGVLIAINNSIKSHIITLSFSNVEQIFALLSFNSNYLLVGGVYLPPHSPFNVVESHVTSIEQIISSYESVSVILCGDYNLPNVTWSSD